MMRRRALLGLVGGLLIKVPSMAGVLYDFESASQGWVNDSSLYYNNNFGLPSVVSSPVHSGSKALSFPLDFTDKHFFNIVNDAVYVQPSSMDLSASAGVTVYAFADQGPGNGNPSYPLVGSVYVKTGDGWVYYEGDQVVLTRNRWHKLTINFTAKGVADRNAIKEIGVKVYGGDYDRGSAVLTIDNVESGLGDDLSAPPAPAGFSASDGFTGNKVNLSWTSPSPDVSHYNVYRGLTSGNLGTKDFVAFVPASQTNFVDTSVVDGIPYHYMVTAADKSGNESAASPEAMTTPSGPSSLSMGVKGMTFASWDVSQWLGLDSDSALDDLKATGANYVAVVVTHYMASPTSNVIDRDPIKSASEAAVASVIQKIHARGMKVLLKPQVDVQDGSWRGAIAPSDPNQWLTNYASFINAYAVLAQSNGVEMLCVGTELKSMTQRRLTDWTSIINGVRSRFSGVDGITYAANANSPNDEFSMVEFWDQLNYVGVNLYFPLTANSVTTADSLKKAWSRSKDGFNMLRVLSDWNALTGKNILVTEIGYQSSDGTNITPFGVDAAFDADEQKQAYEAAFAALNNRSWVRGLFWWTWDPNPNVDGYGDKGYSPQNKPALEVVNAYFGRETTNPIYSFESGVSGWVADATADFADNLGSPATSNQGGSMALRYLLNLDNKSGGIIKDFAYVEPTIPKDLDGYTGLSASVMIPAGASIPSGTPATVALVVQSSSTYRWFQSNTFRNLVPGQWREIHIDFGSATRYIGAVGTPGIPVEFLRDIRRIGVVVTGASGGSGNSQFFIDNVRATGSGTVLGVSIGPGVLDIGSLQPLGTIVSSDSLLVENTGNVMSRYSLSCSNTSPGGWAPDSSSPGVKKFVLNARFNSTPPAIFSETQHAVTTVSAASSATRFAGSDEQGINVAPGSPRHLWLQFKAPTLSDLNDVPQQTLTLGITVEVQ